MSDIPKEGDDEVVVEQPATAQSASAESVEPSANAESVEEAATEPGEDSVESLRAQLENARLAAQAAEEKALRVQAEMENLRKRLARDAEKTRKFALERIMKDLLQVRDTMERGLEMVDESTTVETLREGQELTLKMLAKVLSDNDLEAIEPLGQPFDPEWHEAMTVLPSEEVEENTVLEVLQKGYRLHDRLIRPARVVVSRKP